MSMSKEPQKPPSSVSEHLHRQLSVLIDTDTRSGADKADHVKHKLAPHVREPADAYITLSGNVHQAHLPVLPAWNVTFRKAYTVLFWIRPRLIDDTAAAAAAAIPTQAQNNNLNDASERGEHMRADTEYKRILYRFSTAAEDNQGTGVCVTCSQWKAMEASQANDEQEGTARAPRTLQTTLTAFALPYNNPAKLQKGGFLRGGGSSSTPYASWTQQVLTLTENTWHLVGCTHIYPYLKRPVWCVCVDGAMVSGSPTELHYPVLQESLRSLQQQQQPRTMDYCTVLQNITAGGAAVVQQAAVPVTDDKKTASQLAAQASAVNSSPVLDMQLDVAAVSVYAEAVSPVIQAVLAEAGPVTAQQKYGRIVTTLPPVANWSKGCSLSSGPKVGIPLTVHGTALELQQLSGAVQFAASAVSARVLGTATGSTRLSCPFPPVAGKTDTTPRVGLIEPEAASSNSSSISSGQNHHRALQEDELPVLYVTGHCTVVHALSEYLLLHQPALAGKDENGLSGNLNSVTKNWSTAWTEQQAVTFAVLPIFLALKPPTVEQKSKLLADSWKHLYALYSNGGAYGAALVRLLAAFVRTGGARVHEEVLQNGILHVLANSLRLGLVRASKLKLYALSTEDDFIKRAQKLEEQTALGTSPVNPSYIPPAISEAVVELLDVCCGPTAASLDRLSPAMQIRRTSDLALTALFALALDFDVWGGDVAAASTIWKAVAARYGGICVTTGYVLRSQVSAQHFLDQICLLRFDLTGQSKQVALESVAQSLSQLLQSMLLSSLSSHRSIVQAEKDISACVGALTDCPLGSLTAHVVLSAVVGVLTWCEILPVEAAAVHVEPGDNEEHKVEVAARLGRNLLMAQFHDVVAPVLLSRTVFSGEKSMVTQKSALNVSAPVAGSGLMCWQHHWRLSLLLFSWIASIAGPEGLIASKSTGSLVLASALAGSLEGALDDSDKIVMVTLFMPSPAMALLIGAKLRNEWSYKDLIADRLQIMMPMLPGMIVSLLSHPSDSTSESTIPAKSLTVIADILTSVGGAFHRVFGGINHSAGRQSVKTRGEGSSDAIKAARTYVPHLLVVSMILENHTSIRSPATEGKFVSVMRVPSVDDSEVSNERSGSDSWVDAATSSTVDLVGEIVVSAPAEGEFDTQALVSFLRSCQKSVMSTACGLISNAMALGGAGAALPLWSSILSTLEESVVYAASDVSRSNDRESVQREKPAAASTIDEDGSKGDDDEGASGNKQTWATALAQNVLCRVISLVLLKSLKRQQQWDVWGYELSSAMSKLLTLIEEKELLSKPMNGGDNESSFSIDQIILICSLLDILAYGRETSGWCQLMLPEMASTADKISGRKSGDMTANSKLLLPVLRPCLCVLLATVEYIPSAIKILKPSSKSESGQLSTESLLGLVLLELDQTLTAAIVGLTFSSARVAALHAMATFRKCIMKHKDAGDNTSAELCSSLLTKVAEELRVRYESERRLRDTALFDAYEEAGNSHSAREAAQGSLAVERLILGDGGLGDMSSNSEEISFDDTREDVPIDSSVDFVLFHEPSFGSQEAGAKLGFSYLQGLGAALEECKNASGHSVDGSGVSFSDTISILAPFLDAWDATAAEDAENTELVKLFETNVQLSMDSSSNARRPKQLPILGSETAADAMSTFFEFAAAEKSRLQEISVRFLPGHRSSRKAFSERFCWARYTEVAPPSIERLWERAIPDGNRDVRSRMPTLPCSPQFRRYLPKYLDHGADRNDMISPTDAVSPRESSLEHLRRSSTATIEMDAFTKTLLETGHLEIVDITKKEVEDEEFPEPLQASATTLVDDDENGLYSDAGLDSDDHMTPPVEDQEGDVATFDYNLEADSGSEDLNPTDNVTHEETPTDFASDFAGKGHYSITTSSFSTPPDNSSSSLSLMHSAAAGMIEQHLDNCTHVKAEGNRQCTLLLTSSHLILEYDGNTEGFYEGELLAMQEDADRQKRMAEDFAASKDQNPEALNQQMDEKRQKEVAALRPKSIRWNLSEVSHIYLRRYRLRDSSLELFVIPTGGTSYGGFGVFSPASSLFLDFGSGHEAKTRRDEAAFAIMRRAPAQAIKQWPDRSEQFLHEQLSRLTIGWAEGRITNFDYLLHLNILSGRSYNDSCQYPVFPWVLADYTSEEIPDLTDRMNFRDLTKPVGALNPDRLKDFVERFNSFSDPTIPPFMYGSHYSTSAGVVLHFLVRLHPFAGLHRQLQGGHFDVADRLFSSVPRTWSMCTGSSAAEVKELTPEWYCNPAFLRNENNFKLGTSQDGEVMGDVVLPPWAKGSPEKFVEVMRAALESDICSEMLSDWIDLIFGRKQQGPESVKAHNVFFYLTYYGTVDVASIEDEALRKATELQIAHFGQCPMQLFKRQHVRRLPRSYFNLSLYQLLSAYSQCQLEKKTADNTGAGALELRSPSSHRARLHSVFGQPLFLPFFSAPLSHWVHSNAPPPGPHSPLVAVRFAGTDRCLSVDAKGIFHYFRWAWRADELSQDAAPNEGHFDNGCFVAQRELPRFRSVPRLMHAPNPDDSVVVAISKTLFANRTVLLVLSDGDGCGSLGMQLVDPAKGDIRGEVLVPQIHSARITCIATDPIGTAAGHGGVGGELALVGSADGNASLWRFMSSHYLPLRPRVRLQGHGGEKVVAVALCSAINVAATLSSGKCCLHSTGNGALIRSFGPPTDTIDMQDSDDVRLITKFSDTSALAVSVQGFVVTVCETTIHSSTAPDRNLITLHLFTIEGVSLGSTPLESWRGLPHKMHCTPDGTTVMVCCGRGVTMHRLSACQPLEFLDEFQVTESDDFGSTLCAAWDIDLGPALNRPVVAAAACTGGALRLHALPGISAWSERHKKTGLSQTVGSALASPARRLNRAVRDGLGLGRQLAGIGRDLQREVTSDVKERGVGGFLGNVMFRKNSNKK